MEIIARDHGADAEAAQQDLGDEVSAGRLARALSKG